MSDHHTIFRLAALLRMHPQQLFAAVTVGDAMLWQSFFASTCRPEDAV